MRISGAAACPGQGAARRFCSILEALDSHESNEAGTVFVADYGKNRIQSWRLKDKEYPLCVVIGDIGGLSAER